MSPVSWTVALSQAGVTPVNVAVPNGTRVVGVNAGPSTVIVEPATVAVKPPARSFVIVAARPRTTSGRFSPRKTSTSAASIVCPMRE